MSGVGEQIMVLAMLSTSELIEVVKSLEMLDHAACGKFRKLDLLLVFVDF